MRSFAALCLAVLAVIALGIGLLAAAGDINGSSGVATSVAPIGPHALAVAPDGDLYIVDSLRDQILTWTPNGTFQVVAGTGRRGFSGDGGPAVDAEIHLESDAGIAISRSGTVYFSDSWNFRVRAILPSGVNETVAGGGTTRLGTKSMLAVQANFGPNLQGPAGLTFGPNGQLYMGLAAGVYRLSPNGDLDWVVGGPISLEHWPQGWGGVYSDPAIQADFQRAVRLVFDRAGDLFVAGGGGWGLYEMTRSGLLRFVGTDRQPGGFWGSLVQVPQGEVVSANPYFRGMTDVAVAALSTPKLMSSLGRALDRRPQPLLNGSHFDVFVPENAAFNSARDLFVDSIAGAALPTLPAIALSHTDRPGQSALEEVKRGVGWLSLIPRTHPVAYSSGARRARVQSIETVLDAGQRLTT